MKMIHIRGSLWSKGVVKLKFFKRNINSTMYIEILESSFKNIDSILPKG